MPFSRAQVQRVPQLKQMSRADKSKLMSNVKENGG